MGLKRYKRRRRVLTIVGITIAKVVIIRVECNRLKVKKAG